MAYSTQNMYQMFDIIPNFIRKMFPLSLKTYPSCTNTMAWDIRDEIRSTYILRMVHQRDNQKAAIDDNAHIEHNAPFNIIKEGIGCCRSEPLPKKSSSFYRSSKEKLRHIDSSISNCESPHPCGQTMQLLMDSSSNDDLNRESMTKQPQKPLSAKSPVQKEYQFLAQKFHQYTINCRSTIETLEKKLKKLVNDKHALLHSMVSLRKGQKDIIRKYRKIFNDAMNEHCNEINALLANYRVVRDNYLELLQKNTTVTGNSRKNDELLSVSYTSYNCC